MFGKINRGARKQPERGVIREEWRGSRKINKEEWEQPKRGLKSEEWEFARILRTTKRLGEMFLLILMKRKTLKSEFGAVKRVKLGEEHR